MNKLLVIGGSFAVGFIILVAAPSFLFTEDHELAFDDAALRIAVEGTWRLLPQNGAPVDLVVREGTASTHFSSRGFIRSAAACAGEHTFVRSAAACADTTRMPLDVRVAGELHAGELFVLGRRFGDGRMTIGLGDIHPATGREQHNGIDADITPIGVAFDVRYRGLPATMMRISAH